MTPQIIRDLHKVAEPTERGGYLLHRVIRRLKQWLKTPTSDAELEGLIRAHCTVTDSPSGPVLVGWYLSAGRNN